MTILYMDGGHHCALSLQASLWMQEQCTVVIVRYNDICQMEEPCLPCVVAAESKLLALIIHEEAVLNPDESLSACEP